MKHGRISVMEEEKTRGVPSAHVAPLETSVSWRNLRIKQKLTAVRSRIAYNKVLLSLGKRSKVHMGENRNDRWTSIVSLLMRAVKM